MTTSTHEILDWAVRVEDVPARGLDWRAEATKSERQRLAAALDIVAVNALAAEGRIEAVAGGSYRLIGRLKADVTQACVITLEPVAGSVEEVLSIEFRPADLVEDELVATPNFDDTFEVEPIARGLIETGRIVFELLSASLDPYPRAAGAGLPDVSVAPKGAPPINPFAVLAKLKDKS